uniref:Ceramide glucosyltransferase n=1 Tax=Glossina pallidipes TaxID=7398 RepID=A0A1A9ZRP0_GLOPL
MALSTQPKRGQGQNEDTTWYELLFCVEDKTDPAIQLVESLTAKYPQVEASIFLGGSNVGVNPKINNMHPGYEAAKYELVMISDSGIKSVIVPVFRLINNLVGDIITSSWYPKNLIKVSLPCEAKGLREGVILSILGKAVSMLGSLLLSGISSDLELIIAVGRHGGSPVDALANFRSETFPTLENSYPTYVVIIITTKSMQKSMQNS